MLITGVSRRRTCCSSRLCLASLAAIQIFESGHNSGVARPCGFPEGTMRSCQLEDFGGDLAGDAALSRRQLGRGARPRSSRNCASRSRRSTAPASSSRAAISYMASCSRNSSAMAAKFSMCGPETMARPHAAGSSRLCPPRRASEPPMNTTSARGNRLANSPMESSSTAQGSARSGETVSRDRRR